MVCLGAAGELFQERHPTSADNGFDLFPLQRFHDVQQFKKNGSSREAGKSFVTSIAFAIYSRKPNACSIKILPALRLYCHAK